jgi:hypothetical protein
MRRLRERRRVELALSGDGPVLRSADELLAPAVEETLAALKLGAEHQAAAQLARQLARQMDTCRDPVWGVRWLGPLLLDCLTQLGATPLARSRLQARRPPEPGGDSALARLRQSRASRRGL